MLVTLSLVFCLATTPPSPDDAHPVPPGCQLVRPTPADGWDGGLGACMQLGEQEAVLWLAEHPRWQLFKVRCTPGSAPREDAAPPPARYPWPPRSTTVKYNSSPV
jgi:hypothetical protein